MDKDLGRDPLGQALVQAPSPTVSALTGFDPSRVKGFGNWICEKRAGFFGRPIGSSYSRHFWRWSARLGAHLYLTFNLFPGRLGTRIFHVAQPHKSERTGA